MATVEMKTARRHPASKELNVRYFFCRRSATTSNAEPVRKPSTVRNVSLIQSLSMAYFKEADSDDEYKNTNLTEKIFTDKLFIVNLLPFRSRRYFERSFRKIPAK